MYEHDLDLSSVSREASPPAGLDRRIAGALRRQGLLKRRLPIAFALAAAAVIIVGLFIWQLRAPAGVQARYILLLYESPQFTGGSRAEYGQWARQMRPRVVGGEELAPQDVAALPGAVTPLPENGSRLAGYFLIDAPDDARAQAVARACPHLRHGGAVVLRRIVM